MVYYGTNAEKILNSTIEESKGTYNSALIILQDHADKMRDAMLPKPGVEFNPRFIHNTMSWCNSVFKATAVSLVYGDFINSYDTAKSMAAAAKTDFDPTKFIQETYDRTLQDLLQKAGNLTSQSSRPTWNLLHQAEVEAYSNLVTILKNTSSRLNVAKQLSEKGA